MFSKSVSVSISQVLSPKPSRSALSLICVSLSSPETYKVLAVVCSAICNNKVLFPIPGSPPKSTTAPATSPPPNTKLSSSSGRINLSLWLAWIWFSGLGSAIFRPLFFQAVVCFVGLISSINVFHSLHPGHFPIHLGLSNPQDLQKNVVLALVMIAVV